MPSVAAGERAGPGREPFGLPPTADYRLLLDIRSTGSFIAATPPSGGGW